MKWVKLISGGQTGADRAALDWAIDQAFPHGGWCPEGRIAEDGIIAGQYQVRELAGAGYRERTRANVRDADATLILSVEGTLSGGSLLTAEFAQRIDKPCLHLHPAMDWKERLAPWWRDVQPAVLNVAGPRLSKEPNVAVWVMTVLDYLRGLSDVAPR